MSDYAELIKALRYCAENGDFKCGKDCPMRTEYPNCLTKMDTDAAAAIEDLQAQLQKRGEWELIDGAEPMRWGCSRCKYMSWETSTYCPRCGAKMEVQDIKSVTMREGDTDADGFFRKAFETVMEVQE